MDRLVIRSKEHDQELSGIGARESEMDIKDTIGQQIDKDSTEWRISPVPAKCA